MYGKIQEALFITVGQAHTNEWFECHQFACVK